MKSRRVNTVSMSVSMVMMVMMLVIRDTTRNIGWVLSTVTVVVALIMSYDSYSAQPALAHQPCHRPDDSFEGKI